MLARILYVYSKTISENELFYFRKKISAIGTILKSWSAYNATLE